MKHDILKIQKRMPGGYLKYNYFLIYDQHQIKIRNDLNMIVKFGVKNFHALEYF